MQRNLLWIDLEMTGLDAENDVILEIAIIASDYDGNNLIEGPDIVIHQPNEALQKMTQWVRETHTKSGLLDRVESSNFSIEEAEQQVLSFIQQQCPNQLYFAGNSIYQDRNFIKKYMPQFNKIGHYRMVDVSTLKVLIQSWYANDPQSQFKKEKRHRALDDIKESIEELKYYRTYFFK